MHIKQLKGKKMKMLVRKKSIFTLSDEKMYVHGKIYRPTFLIV